MGTEQIVKRERPISTSIYVLPSVIDEIEDIAKRQGQSRNNLIQQILMDWLEKEQY